MKTILKILLNESKDPPGPKGFQCTRRCQRRVDTIVYWVKKANTGEKTVQPWCKVQAHPVAKFKQNLNNKKSGLRNVTGHMWSDSLACPLPCCWMYCFSGHIGYQYQRRTQLMLNAAWKWMWYQMSSTLTRTNLFKVKPRNSHSSLTQLFQLGNKRTFIWLQEIYTEGRGHPLWLQLRKKKKKKKKKMFYKTS